MLQSKSKNETQNLKMNISFVERKIKKKEKRMG